MLTLFHSPGTCSLGIHCLLEEIGAPYELRLVDVTKGQQHSPDFVAVNPKSKVPALNREQGGLLTEWPAIATWLALTHPQTHLLPTDAEGMARALESVDYVVATVHMQGFTRIFKPDHFSTNEADHPAIREKGRQIFEKGLASFNEKLGDHAYLGGDEPSIADFALFYIEFWRVMRMKLELPAHLAGHFTRMKQRPAVARALAQEGFAQA